MYYYEFKDSTIGPVSDEVIQQLIHAGVIGAATLVSSDDGTGWVTLAESPLSKWLQTPRPPQPQPPKIIKKTAEVKPAGDLHIVHEKSIEIPLGAAAIVPTQQVQAKIIITPVSQPMPKGDFLKLIHHQFAMVVFVFIGVIFSIIALSSYLNYRNRIAAEKAGAERLVRVANNTVLIWLKYKSILKQNSAALSLDDVQAIMIKREQMQELLGYEMDSDLRRQIKDRIDLVDSGKRILDQAVAEANKIQSDTTIDSFLAGMVGGALNPDNPIRAGFLFGRAAEEGSKGKITELTDRLRQSLQGIQDEDKQLDAYEPILESLLKKRYPQSWSSAAKTPAN